jgi:WD40 repeat protein
VYSEINPTLYWSPDGKEIALLYNYFSNVDLWIVDIDEAEIIETSRLDYDRVFGVKWLADSNTLQILVADGDNRTLQIQTKPLSNIIRLQEQTGVVFAAWSPDGTKLYTTGGIGDISDVPNDFALRLWDVNSGSEMASVVHYWGQMLPFSMQWSTDSSQIAAFYYSVSAVDYSTRVWNVDTGEVEKEFSRDREWRLREGHMLSRAWSPDLTRLAYTAFVDPATDPSGLLIIRDFSNENPSSIEIEIQESGRLHWSPDATKIAVVDADQIQIWDTLSGKLLNTLDTHDRIPNSAISWTDNGLRWIAFEDDNTLSVWQLDNDEPLLSLDVQYPSDQVTILPDGDTLFANNELWSISDPKVPLPIQAPHFNGVWSHNQTCAASASYVPNILHIDQSYVTIFGIPDATLLTESKDIGLFKLTDLVWSPSGSLLAVGSEDGQLRIFTLENL